MKILWGADTRMYAHVRNRANPCYQLSAVIAMSSHNKWLHPLLPSPCKQPVVLHTYNTIAYHRVRMLVTYQQLSCVSVDMYTVYRMWKMMLGHSPSAFPSLGSSTHGFTHMNIKPHIINTWRYSILYLLLSLTNHRNRRQ